MSDSKRLIGLGFWALAGLLWLGGPGTALAQGQGQAEGAAASKGENFSAKPAAQLFASDCTGAGCHKGPQGLAKNGGIGLAGFLREHYTNSRESAAALASYLSKLPSGPEPKDKEKEGRGGQRTATRPAPPSSVPNWGTSFGFPSGEPGASARPEPKETRSPKQAPNTRTSRAPARHEEAGPEKPTAATPQTGPDVPSSEAKTGTNTRAAQHARPAEPAIPAEAAAPPPAPAASPPAATAQTPAPKPAAQQFDIFD